jgi:hypothetical protein
VIDCLYLFGRIGLGRGGHRSASILRALRGGIGGFPSSR